MDKNPPGDGGQSDISQAKGDRSQDEQEEEGMGECPSHVRGPEY